MLPSRSGYVRNIVVIARGNRARYSHEITKEENEGKWILVSRQIAERMSFLVKAHNVKALTRESSPLTESDTYLILTRFKCEFCRQWSMKWHSWFKSYEPRTFRVLIKSGKRSKIDITRKVSTPRRPLTLSARGYLVGSRELQIKNTIRVFAGRAHTSHECFLNFTTQQHTRTARDELCNDENEKKRKYSFHRFSSKRRESSRWRRWEAWKDRERTRTRARDERREHSSKQIVESQHKKKTKFWRELFPSQSSVSRYVPSQEVVWVESLCDICGYSCIY